MMNEQALIQPQRERLLKVFEFLKAYTELRYPPVRDIGQQLRVLWLKDLPQHPSVEIFQGDRGPDTESEDADVILRITRPDRTDCPSPPAAIADWLKPGWQNLDGNVEVHASHNIRTKDGGTRIERFEEDRALRPLFQRLEELGITADLELSRTSSLPTADAVTQRVIRRAQELRAVWQDERLPTDEAEHSSESHGLRTRRGGRFLDQDFRLV